jgi:hypothetical protein
VKERKERRWKERNGQACRKYYHRRDNQVMFQNAPFSRLHVAGSMAAIGINQSIHEGEKHI